MLGSVGAAIVIVLKGLRTARLAVALLLAEDFGKQ